MDGLIRLLTVALGGLASTKEGQACAVQLDIHERRDGESPISQAETALERLLRILLAMARQMHDVRLWKNVCHLLNGCRELTSVAYDVDERVRVAHKLCNLRDLALHLLETSHVRLGCLIGSRRQHSHILPSHRSGNVPRPLEGGEAWRIRGDDVVCAAFLRASSVHPCSVKWKKGCDPERIPMKSGTIAAG
jgi:hypothetical protein